MKAKVLYATSNDSIDNTLRNLNHNHLMNRPITFSSHCENVTYTEMEIRDCDHRDKKLFQALS